MRIEEMEGMEAVVGPELAVVVEDKDDDVFNVEGLDREAAAEASVAALDEGTTDAPAAAPAALDEISLHLASSVSGVEVFSAAR